MKHCTWIQQSLNAGGTLRVKAILPGKAIYSARMSWPGEQDVAGNISMDLAGALENLDGMLQEDAAKEMMESGAV